MFNKIFYFTSEYFTFSIRFSMQINFSNRLNVSTAGNRCSLIAIVRSI